MVALFAYFYLTGVASHHFRRGKIVADGYFQAPWWLLLACGCFGYNSLRMFGFWLQVAGILTLILYPILLTWFSERALFNGLFFGGVLFASVGCGIHHYFYQRRYQRRRAKRREKKRKTAD